MVCFVHTRTSTHGSTIAGLRRHRCDDENDEEIQTSQQRLNNSNPDADVAVTHGQVIVVGGRERPLGRPKSDPEKERPGVFSKVERRKKKIR